MLHEATFPFKTVRYLDGYDSFLSILASPLLFFPSFIYLGCSLRHSTVPQMQKLQTIRSAVLVIPGVLEADCSKHRAKHIVVCLEKMLCYDKRLV